MPNLQVPRDQIADFCRTHHITRLAFFGSVLRDDFGPASDVDVLVEFEPKHPVGLITLAAMEIELSEILGRKAAEFAQKRAGPTWMPTSWRRTAMWPPPGLRCSMEFRLSRHAREEVQRRNIPPGLVDAVLHNPEQTVPGHGGKQVYQSRLDFGGGDVFLLRAIVNDTVDPAVVVTVYRTSKIAKYWRTS